MKKVLKPRGQTVNMQTNLNLRCMHMSTDRGLSGRVLDWRPRGCGLEP